MKLNVTPFALLAAASLSAAIAHAETDKETKEALKEANDTAKRMNLQMSDVEKMVEEADKDDATPTASPQKNTSPKKETVKSGPPILPDWTPPVPQFKPDGPVSKKKVQGEEVIAQTGTSPLTPAELGDAWETAKTAKFSRGRNNLNINDKITVKITLSTYEEPKEEVHLEAVRGPKEKITHVTIYSPLPKAAGSED